MQTDRLNTVINISNKIKDFSTSITYTNLNSFTFYSHWKKFYKQNKNNRAYSDLLYSIFYYEIQRNLLWNTVFFLPADTFMNIYESKIKNNLFEKINEKYSEFTYEEASYVTQNVITSLKAENSQIKEFAIPTKLTLPKPSSSYGKYVPVADISTFGTAKIKDIKIGELQYSYHNSFVSLLIKEDIKTWVPEWSTKVKVKRILNIVDHSDSVVEGENEILNDIERAIKKEDLLFKFCKLTDDGKGLHPLFNDNYKELSSKRSENISNLIRLLFPLKLFNKKFVEFINNSYKLGLSIIEIDEAFQIDEPLFSPINKEWYRIDQSDTIADEINPIPLKKIRKNVLKRIASLIVKEIDNNRSKEGNDLFMKEIAPLLEYLYLDVITIISVDEKISSTFLSRFARSLQKWEPKSLFSFVAFAELNKNIFEFDKYGISLEKDISEGVKSWFEIAEKKNRKNKRFIQSATILSEKICSLDIDENIKSSLLSASITINTWDHGSIRKAKKLLNQFFDIDKSEKPFIKKARILQKTNKKELAITTLTEAITLFPKEIDLYKELQYLFNETKQYEELIKVQLNILNKFTDNKHETFLYT